MFTKRQACGCTSHPVCVLIDGVETMKRWGSMRFQVFLTRPQKLAEQASETLTGRVCVGVGGRRGCVALGIRGATITVLGVCQDLHHV